MPTSKVAFLMLCSASLILQTISSFPLLTEMHMARQVLLRVSSQHRIGNRSLLIFDNLQECLSLPSDSCCIAKTLQHGCNLLRVEIKFLNARFTRTPRFVFHVWSVRPSPLILHLGARDDFNTKHAMIASRWEHRSCNFFLHPSEKADCARLESQKVQFTNLRIIVPEIQPSLPMRGAYSVTQTACIWFLYFDQIDSDCECCKLSCQDSCSSSSPGTSCAYASCGIAKFSQIWCWSDDSSESSSGCGDEMVYVERNIFIIIKKVKRFTQYQACG